MKGRSRVAFCRVVEWLWVESKVSACSDGAWSASWVRAVSESHMPEASNFPAPSTGSAATLCEWRMRGRATSTGSQRSNGQGRARLSSRNVGGPAIPRGWEGEGESRKQKTRGGLGPEAPCMVRVEVRKGNLRGILRNLEEPFEEGTERGPCTGGEVHSEAGCAHTEAPLHTGGPGHVRRVKS